MRLCTPREAEILGILSPKSRILKKVGLRYLERTVSAAFGVHRDQVQAMWSAQRSQGSEADLRGLEVVLQGLDCGRDTQAGLFLPEGDSEIFIA